MPVTNLKNRHLTEDEKRAVENAITELRNALEMVNVNLSTEERRRYGSINEQNKLFVNRIDSYRVSHPELRSQEVDWVEFERDFQSRLFLEKVIDQLDTLRGKLQNAKILHDYDNYQDSLEDYSYTTYRAKSNSSGFEDKYRQLKQFFTRNKRENGKNTPKPSEENNQPQP